MTSLSKRALLLVGPALLAQSACGTSSSSSEPVFTSSATQVSFSASVDGPTSHQPTSTCAQQYDQITYDAPAATLTFTICDGRTGNPYDLTGVIALTPQDASTLTSVLSQMVPDADRTQCEADGTAVEVDIETAGVVAKYLAVGSYCGDTRGIPAASGVELAEGTAVSIIQAHNPVAVDAGL